MTNEEAIEVLKAEGYVPGRDRTYGLAPERVGRITGAVQVLKAAGMLQEAIRELTRPKPPKKKPVTPAQEDSDDG